MGFAASLAFFAIGAILAFAVKWDVPGVDLQLIGWIFMGVGVADGLITRMYTRTPREVREETAESAEPDAMSTRKTPVAPHARLPRSGGDRAESAARDGRQEGPSLSSPSAESAAPSTRDTCDPWAGAGASPKPESGS
ncbi:DUF6458 family protein [Thermostaphylospora chromogena]|uniref:DUF6458 domain-containing protein n=1 Tax=Thermostaphylospora chromogena TaxID=35622 RepID=A0A1H1GI64_9ACTN|nr:hypothetical protein SAMN04489764_3610 [Thermostaphylospora chromogena]